MNICSAKNDPRYRRIEECIPKDYNDVLMLDVDYYVKHFGDIPRMDELSYVDSSKLLKKSINLQSNKNTQYTNTETILDYTHSKTIEEARVKLNTDLHSDLDIDLLQIGKQTIVYSDRRPKMGKLQPVREIDTDNNPEKNRIILTNMMENLSKKLGINFIPITNAQLCSQEWSNRVRNAGLVNAFVYNGDIYINLDNAQLDAPIHELSHILIGNLRFTNPTLYTQLLSIVQELPNFNKLSKQYLDRTQNDILEEIFVTEFAKYAAGYQSEFDKLDEKTLHEITYHMNRTLDTMISGEYSVKNLSVQKILSSSLLDLGALLSSKRMSNLRTSSVSLDQIHRIVNNEKSNLMKKGDLIEECT